MCKMKMERKCAAVYGFMVSVFLPPFLTFWKPPGRHAVHRHVTTHAVFVSWWPLAAVRFMSLIPGSTPSIHFAAVLSSPPNIKLLPIARNAVSQKDVCIWHRVLSGDQPERNNRCPWLHHWYWMATVFIHIFIYIFCSLFNSLSLLNNSKSKLRALILPLPLVKFSSGSVGFKCLLVFFFLVFTDKYHHKEMSVKAAFNREPQRDAHPCLT